MNIFSRLLRSPPVISMQQNTTQANWRPYVLLGWMLIMPLSFSSVLGYMIYNHEAYLQTLTIAQWVIIYALSILTMAFALTPTTIIALISGYFLGFWAIIPLILTYSIASIIGYLISKPLGRNFQLTLHQAYPRLDEFIHRMSNSSPIGFVLFSRISPVLPFAVMNVVLPFIGIKFRHFFWGGMAGMLPRTLLAILSGSIANSLINLINKPNSSSYMQIGFAVLLAISIFGFILLFKRPLRR